MNRQELEGKRVQTLSKYRYLGLTYYPSLLINKTIHQNNESLRHEIACYMIDCIIQRGGDVRVIFPMIEKFIQEFSDKITPIFKHWCFKGNERKIISQAVASNKRKIDRVILDSGEKIEVETGKSYKKEDDVTTVYI